MAITHSPNLWVGDFVKDLNTATVLGGSSVLLGIWRIVNSTDTKTIVPLFDALTDIDTIDFCNSTPSDIGNLSDIEVESAILGLHRAICKSDFYGTSMTKYQSSGLWNKEVPQHLIESFLIQVANSAQKGLENLRWSGDKTATAPFASFNKQDGVLTQMAQSGSTNVVGGATASAITSPSTVLDELYKLVNALPANVASSSKMSIVVSAKVARAYQQFMASTGAQTLAYMNMAMTENLQNDMNNGFIGYLGNTPTKIFKADGFTNNGVNDFSATAIAGIFTDTSESSLVLVTDAQSDETQIMVHDRQTVNPMDPYVEIGWQYKQGIAVLRPEQTALYLGV